jgi:hypothetical protein
MLIGFGSVLTDRELQAVSAGLSPLGVVAALVKGPPPSGETPAAYDRDLEDLQVER